MGRSGVWLTVFFAGLYCGPGLVLSRVCAADGAAQAGVGFFEEKIRPVLAQSCFQCHSARATKLKGALALDTAENALMGGKSGVAIVPGNPDASPLMKAIRRGDPDSAMPPEDKDKLSDEAVANFEKWIKAGAPFPASSGAEKPAALKPWWDELADAKLQPASAAIPAVVDFYINEKLKAAKLQPVSTAGDANFVRRVTLDLVGRIPTPAEVRAYETSEDSNKKERLVDRLMASPAFVRQQVTELNWLLMDGKTGDFAEFLGRELKENRGWDSIFRDVISADATKPATKGSEQFLKVRAQDQDRMTSDVSVRFFGVNISCAQCHDHPHVPAWTQDHYYGMKSFFSRTFEAGEFVGEREYGYVTFKPLKSEQTRRAALLFLDGQTLAEPEVSDPDDAAKKAERQAIDEWKKNKQQPAAPKFSRRAKVIEAGLSAGRDGFFARAIVNQIWARLFGQGLVMPVDQMHGQNRPSHPELLAWLARDLAGRKYDLRGLIRGLVLSDAYARGSAWPGADRPDARLWAVATPRPMTPQQLSTSLMVSSADPDVFENAAGVEAAVEKLERDGQSLAGVFERPRFDFQVGVDEALAISNSEQIAKLVMSNENGRLIQKLSTMQNVSQLLRTAYASVLSRAPDSRETQVLEEFLKTRANRPAEGVRDMVWALLASTEFRFNH